MRSSEDGGQHSRNPLRGYLRLSLVLGVAALVSGCLGFVFEPRKPALRGLLFLPLPCLTVAAVAGWLAVLRVLGWIALGHKVLGSRRPEPASQESQQGLRSLAKLVPLTSHFLWVISILLAPLWGGILVLLTQASGCMAFFATVLLASGWGWGLWHLARIEWLMWADLVDA